MADVPADEEVAAKWMHELYQRKVRGSRTQPACLMTRISIGFTGSYAG
jgi:hypothetical protein